MLYMIIERFKGRNAAAVYDRFQRLGRMMPDGLKYLDSWIETNDDRCFQLMETNDPQTFSAWTAAWSDLVDFEIIPVTTAAATRERFAT
jgi:hypothetical protein